MVSDVVSDKGQSKAIAEETVIKASAAAKIFFFFIYFLLFSVYLFEIEIREILLFRPTKRELLLV